jgi:hypothetical protein
MALCCRDQWISRLGGEAAKTVAMSRKTKWSKSLFVSYIFS